MHACTQLVHGGRDFEFKLSHPTKASRRFAAENRDELSSWANGMEDSGCLTSASRPVAESPTIKPLSSSHMSDTDGARDRQISMKKSPLNKRLSSNEVDMRSISEPHEKMQGFLLKKGTSRYAAGRRWQKRWFFIDGSVLRYSNRQGGRVIGAFDLSVATINHVDEGKYDDHFQLCLPGGGVMANLRALSSGSLDSWTSSISRISKA